MSTYRVEWPCCGSVTETEAWEPEHCPFCHETPLEKAAPDLLEALQELEKEFRKTYPIYYYADPWGHETNAQLQKARTAIAKATGEQA